MAGGIWTTSLLALSAVALLAGGALGQVVVPQCFHTRNLPTESDPCKHSFDAAFLHGSVLTVQGLTAAGANATFTRGCLPLSTTRGCNPAGSLCCADGAPKALQAYEVQLFTRSECLSRANLAAFKQFRWSFNGATITPIYNTRTPALLIRRKWWDTATLCVDVPVGTASPCNSLATICGPTGCQATLVTTPFKQGNRKGACKMETNVEYVCSPPCKSGTCTASNTCDITGATFVTTGARCNGTAAPSCDDPCKHGGVCVSEGECDCTGTGYTGPTCKKPICTTLCANNGICIAPNTCNCTSSYTGPTCQTPVCTLPCANGAACVAPNTCNCTGTGYRGSTCETPACRPRCQHGGKCTSPNTCDCSRTNFTGPTCEVPIIPQPPKPPASVCKVPCENDGVCNGTNSCDCTGTGYEGPICENPVCTSPCQHNGTCVTPDTCDCTDTGYNGTVCEIPVCSKPCLNGGVCSAPNTCDCSKAVGFTGELCEEKICNLATGLVCKPSLTCCNGGCVDLLTDENDCGQCNAVCSGTDVCMMGTCAPCPIGATYMYGIADNQKIYEVDVTDRIVNAVHDARPDIPSGLANGFAYDTARDQFFFLSADKQLQFWDRVGRVTSTATAAQLGLTGSQPANAVYYQDAFWFVDNTVRSVTKQKLVRIGLNYDAAGRPSFGSRTAYSIDIHDQFGNSVAVYDQFGDIAVANGIMYFATSPFSGAANTHTGAFYSLDLASLPAGGGAGAQAIMIKPPSNGNIGLQLSFSCDFKTLWAQDYNTCDWYTVDTKTGDLTFQFRLNLPGTTSKTCLRDLGGAACTCAAGAS